MGCAVGIGGLLLAAMLAGCSGDGLFGAKEPRREPVYVEDVPPADTTTGVYDGTHRRHYLAKILDEGATLVLDDGSVWRVREEDLMYSTGWEHHQDILVQDVSAAPQYRLVNRASREQVLAEYLGTPPEM